MKNKCDCGKDRHMIDPFEECPKMTKQAKHTQGQWRSEFEIDGSFWIMADKKIVASVEPRYNARANAHLIASAPELLFACKAMFNRLGFLGDLDPNHDDVRRWEKAIAKAMGEV